MPIQAVGRRWSDRWGYGLRQRKECGYCGALADSAEDTCKLCGRPLAGAALVESATHSDLFLNADGNVIDLTPPERAKPLGFDGRTWTTIAMGVLFVLAYPWLLAWHGSHAAGTAMHDLSLAICWLAPEAYLVSGMVRSAHRANRARSVVPSLSFAVIAVGLQVASLWVARELGLTPATTVQVFRLSGPVLAWQAPVALYAVSVVCSAFVAAWMPKVVQGKFNRVVAPQLGCLSVLLAALLLPTWGGLALLSRTAEIGIAPFWIDLLAMFVIPVFALFWFWPDD